MQDDHTLKNPRVAKTFRQVEGLHYDELHKDTIQVFLSLVNKFNLKCDQVNIVSAFLNGNLRETIYVHPPELSNIPNGKVLLLKKSLYGLKQSPRCFNKKFNSWLKSGWLHSCQLYILRKGENLIVLSIHVDDQLIASNNCAALDNFKRQLNNKSECKDFGPANHFIGFDIHRDRPNQKLYISPEQYLQEVLARFDLEDCDPVKQPLPTGFRPIVGSVLYASMISRPNLAHPAGVLSRFLSKWQITLQSGKDPTALQQRHS
jgi:hypothetical protein